MAAAPKLLETFRAKRTAKSTAAAIAAGFSAVAWPIPGNVNLVPARINGLLRIKRYVAQVANNVGTNSVTFNSGLLIVSLTAPGGAAVTVDSVALYQASGLPNAKGVRSELEQPLNLRVEDYLATAGLRLTAGMVWTVQAWGNLNNSGGATTSDLLTWVETETLLYDGYVFPE